MWHRLRWLARLLASSAKRALLVAPLLLLLLLLLLPLLLLPAAADSWYPWSAKLLSPSRRSNARSPSKIRLGRKEAGK